MIATSVTQQSYVKYFEMFNDFQLFGLPHGRGSLHELPWVTDFIRFMTRVVNIIELSEMPKA